MSEAVTQDAPVADGITPGSLLRQAREAAGLHVAALAVALKVPVRKLEALENDQWEEMPDLVFVRALASSVCRTLKIDPQPVLERLPRTAAPRLVHEGEGINAPFRAPGDGAPPSLLDQLTKPVFLVVLVILLGALILILMPTRQETVVATLAPATLPPEPPPPIVVPGPDPVAAPVMTSLAASAPLAAGSTTGASPPSVPEAKPASAVAKPASAAASRAVPSASASAARASSPAAASGSNGVAVAAAGPASGVVIFRTSGPSWVEVTDAKGVVALRRQLESGESVGASGALPLTVIVGRADNTSVQVRGRAYDLRPVSRDNVAKFEVK